MYLPDEIDYIVCARQMHSMLRARITKFNIHKNNGEHFTRYRSISAADRRFAACRQPGRHSVRFGSLLPFLYFPIVIQTSIGAIAKSISRSRGLSPHPARSLSFSLCLWRRLVFCDRRLTPSSLSTPPRRHPLSFRRRVR